MAPSRPLLSMDVSTATPRVGLRWLAVAVGVALWLVAATSGAQDDVEAPEASVDAQEAEGAETEEEAEDAEEEAEDEAEDEADDEDEAAEGDEGPTTVYIGLYLLRIHDLDLHAGTASVTYIVWTHWEGDVDGAGYELVSGTVDSQEHEFQTIELGEHYAYYRCRATVAIDFDFRPFPFDDHTIKLDFEHSDEDENVVRFVVDEDSVRNLPHARISGWDVDPPRYEVIPHEYNTNWGFPGVPADDVGRFSRFRVSLRIRHSAGATFIKTFLALLISVLIGFLGVWMDPEELEARVGVCVAGVFGVVTSQAVVAGNLPDIPYLTLCDKVHLAGLIFIFMALVESCFAAYYQRHERRELALRIDRLSRSILVPAFALLVGLLVWVG
ncbi:MAG: hypothetical protein KDA28_14755 [Phycisphaerales bacterium]|nr:hypothetical protein [Phycisphaerales bacterium]